MSDSKKSHHVIIGAGIAGISAAEAIRETDTGNEIILINGENTTPYCRPLIVDVLRGEKSFEDIYLRQPDWFAEKNITLITGDPVTKLNPAKNQLVLESGQTIEWEKLLIATGSKPATPPIKGLDEVPSFTLYLNDDVEKLKSLCKPGSKAILAGIGLIGLQAMTSLRELGVEVTAVELLPKVLPLVLDSKAAEYAKARLEAHGIEVLTGTGITELGKSADGDFPYTALTDKGHEIEYDFLVMAAGMRPDLALLNDSGIEIDRGIKVDPGMATNIHGIYAAGDVTVFENQIEGRAEIHAHWVNAFKQGRIAGNKMAGGAAEPYEPMFLNSLDVMGLPIIAIGASRIDNPVDADIYVSENPSRPSYKRLVLKDGKLIAATFVNDVQNAGVFHYFLKEQIDIGDIAGSLFDRGIDGMEFLYKHHNEIVAGKDIDWPESMSLIEWFRKDHKHTRWGKKENSDKTQT